MNLYTIYYMATIKLSALSIFLILLAVILIGFLLHHTWESFTSCKSEGFTADYMESTVVSQALYGEYSKNNLKIAKLADNLYFDPGNDSMIEKHDNNLYIKRKDGTDLSYNVNANEYIINDLSAGQIVYENQGIYGTTTMGITANTVAEAKIGFEALNASYVYMHVTGLSRGSGSYSSPPLDTDTITGATAYAPTDVAVSNTNAEYPVLSSTAYTTNQASSFMFERVLKPKGLLASKADTGSNPQSYGWYTQNGYGVVFIPLYVNDLPTNTCFIHVMNVSDGSSGNKHIATYYFQGSQVEMFTYTGKKIYSGTLESGNSFINYVDQTNTTTSEIVFSKSIGSVTLPNNATDEKLYTQVSHDADKELIYFAAKVDNNAVQAYIKVGSDRVPVIVKMEMTGSANTEGSGSDNNDNNTGNYKTNNNTGSSVNELMNALNLVKEFQSVFGSTDSNYLLKTEVVPPVCPTCPSCPNGGPCTNCGGNGGSGTQGTENTLGNLAEKAGTGATNLVRDGADGVTNIARDTAKGTYDVGKEVVGGTKDVVTDAASGTGKFLKDTGSGVGQFAKDSASGIFNSGKNVASGAYDVGKEAGSAVYGVGKEAGSAVYGVGKEAGSAAYGAGRDVGSAAYGAGRDVGSGVGNMIPGPSANGGGYNNSYGGPGYSQGGYNQGGYMQPRQPATAGQDPYSYYGAVQPRYGGCNYMPRTADFSSFGK
jgi:hypothetical protein